MLETYAKMLNALQGQYITALEVDITLFETDFLAKHALNVSGTTKGGSGNPFPSSPKALSSASRQHFSTAPEEMFSLASASPSRALDLSADRCARNSILKAQC